MKQQPLNLSKILKKNLNNREGVVVLGVGSELRGDDVAGMLAAELISKKSKNRSLKVILGGTAPENFTGEIKKLSPSHLIMIDAADTGAKPGTISIIDSETVGGISFSTHMMPLKVMVDYIRESINCSVLIIGIQPKNIKFGAKVSREIKTSATQIAEAVLSAL
ncbi:MAG: hydrogenase maturation peptidase HycI [Endomicrobiales bacterium]|nr:hydrogenase maturation peptidase HycI [Endomicrobiales bacterium]